MVYILRNTPDKKRIAYLGLINQETVAQSTDDELEDYSKAAKESFFGGIMNTISDGADWLGDKGYDIGGEIGEKIGRVVGGTVGAVVSTVKSVVSSFTSWFW